jgi:hypothetical protein
VILMGDFNVPYFNWERVVTAQLDATSSSLTF